MIRAACIALTSFTVGLALEAQSASPKYDSKALYLDQSSGRDWPGYGRTFGQQHYSPLAQINESNVSRLRLAWWLDLEPLKNAATQPIAVDGVLYFATGLSVVHAVDAASGKVLWRYDPKAAEKAGLNLRHGWGVRGIAWWNGKIYTGTVDGRLIAIDAKNGKPVWSVQTFEPDFPAHINGAPRVFDGKVIIGYAGTVGASRGFVTTYDAETGKRLWRFYTVPGNPADGFENEVMAMAAKTWAGEWWKQGGGGANVWGTIAYDPETDTVFIGTGSAYVHNRKIRSADRGDNLFVSSIVALDGKTGAYKWHYQTTPGDTWDFDAIMDIEFADLPIGGQIRKVLMQAPKNGFFYVIDRITGQLISAEPYAKVTWAARVDMKTGRPIENPGVRYPNGTAVEIWPMAAGAHSWMPMAYNPETRLAYIPKIEYGMLYNDKEVDLKNWRPPTNRAEDFGISPTPLNGVEMEGALVAWNPVAQKAVWTVPHPTMNNSGILTTGGRLVFQGTIDGTFKSYSAASGKVSGTIVYGPFMRKLRFGSVRYDRSARVKWLDLHNLLGIATLIWLFTVGLTGVINTLALPIFGHWQTTELADMTARYKDAPALTQPGSAERAVATARQALPQSDLSFMAFPGNEFSTPHHYVAFMHGSTPLTSRLLTPILIDAETNELVDRRTLPWYVTALLISQPLHFGDYGGLPLKILWALLDGIAIVVLGSGVYLWMKKRNVTVEERLGLVRSESVA